MKRVITLILGAMLLNCSFVTTIPAPNSTVRESHHRHKARCTYSYGAPAVDTVFAGLFGAGGAVPMIDAIVRPGNGNLPPIEIGVAITSFVMTAVFGISAIYGFHSSNECRQYMSED